jgi:regulator of cell morphogenesis and NO signaling
MTKTIGEIARENPASVRVFEKYSIDFCCGGKISFGEACRKRGIAPAELQAELEQAAAGRPASERDWSEAPLALLIDHIVGTHHVYLKSELPRLQGWLDKVIAAHGEVHSEMLVPLGEAFGALRAELEAHLAKEEMILFPLIKRMEGGDRSPAHCGSVNNPIRVMVHEHDNAGRALETMREITADYTVPADGCNTFRALFHGLVELEADLHRHIHLENNILFPKAEALEEQAGK